MICSPYQCNEDTPVYNAVENLCVGDVVDLTGFLYWYEGPNPHITEVKNPSIFKNAVKLTGTAPGIDGNITVLFTADQSLIYSVEIIDQNETPGIGSIAVEKLPDAIVQANSISVDGISGATVPVQALGKL